MRKLLYGLGAVIGIALVGIAGFLFYFLLILPKDLPVKHAVTIVDTKQ
jgi:hypothetical protein